MRKTWMAGAALLAAVLLISGCGQKPEHTETAATEAAEEPSVEEPSPENASETVETAGDGEDQGGAAIIGGADGPTAIFLAFKYDLTDMEEAVKYYILNKNEGRLKDYPLQLLSFRTLAEEETGAGTVRYLYYGQFGCQLSPDGHLNEKEEETGGHFGLVKITLDKDENGEYRLVDYWTPREGGLLDDDVRENFPEEIQEEAITAHEKYGKEISRDCLKQARELAAQFAGIGGTEHSGEEPLLEPTTIASGEEPDMLQPTTVASDEPPEVIPVE